LTTCRTLRPGRTRSPTQLTDLHHVRLRLHHHGDRGGVLLDDDRDHIGAVVDDDDGQVLDAHRR
jgi:hypothetical protein